MKNIIDWFVNNIVAANLFMALILISGYFTLPKILMEVFPAPVLDIISISVPYPGASPEDIEKSICTKIEENISGIESVKKIRSAAIENQGRIYVELLPGEDISEAKEEIISNVNSITSFPDEAEKPKISVFKVQSQVMQVAVSGDLNEESLSIIAKRIQDEISTLPGITLTTLAGLKSKEISIEISESQLKKYSLTFDRVIRAVKSSSIDLPGGKIESKNNEYLIRTNGQANNGLDFQNITILTKADGTRLKLGDIATVKDGFVEDSATLTFNGQPTKLINIYRVGKQNAIKVSDSVNEYIDKTKKILPEGITLTTWNDESKILRGRIDLLLKNAKLGLFLVLVMLALFLKPKLAFWVSLGIPISFMGALIMLPYLDVSINLLSLFTFILVLGIVVDDAVIVGENIYRHIEKGEDLKTAASKGAYEVGIPVIFAVLTTIATFSPMLFVEGSVGRVWRIIPLVVIPTLFWSLIESLSILPAHLAHMKSNKVKSNFFSDISKKWEKFQSKIETVLKLFIKNKYKPFLEKSVKTPFLTVSIFVFILLINIGIIGGGWLKFSFFPPIEAEVIQVEVTFPLGTPIEVTNEAIDKIQKAAISTDVYFQDTKNQKLFLNTLTSVGMASINTSGQTGGPGGGGMGTYTYSSHKGFIWAELIGGEDRLVAVNDIVNKWRQETGEIVGVKDLQFRASLFDPGEPINIQLTGLDFSDLNIVVAKIKEHLENYIGVFDIKDSYSDGKDQLNISILPEAENYGITNLSLATQVRQAFYGQEIQTIQRGRDEIKVNVRYPKDDRVKISNLENMNIRTPDGREIPFKLVGKIDESISSPSITRINRKRAINITADIDISKANSNEIVRNLENDFLPTLLSDYPYVSYSLEGEQREQNENLESLFNNYILALVLVYILLAIPFKSYIQPLVVMSAIPFGIIGAVIGHLLLGMNFTILSMIGIVALSGVVVNDSLVLVDFINRYRNKGKSIKEAAIESGQARFRPILLTSITTFVGLIPLLLEKSLQAQFLIPMAVSLGFGVLFSTFITLILVPNGVIIIDQIRTKFSR